MDLGEPLSQSAPLARRLAPRLCRPIGPGATDCSSYHGLLQYMRLLGLVPGPARHWDLYRAALHEAAMASGGPPRVLIAGAADYGMLAVVLAALEGTGVVPDVTVVDRCPTPLELCRWYARHKGVDLATAVADATELHDDAGFDVICTDSLLTLLPPATRERALVRWRELLRPGGRIATSARISNKPYATDATPEQRIAAFSELVREKASECRAPLGVEPDVLAAEALTYGGSIPVYPIKSGEELEALFATAGLHVEAELLELAGPVPAARAGPSTWQTATFARIVARAH